MDIRIFAMDATEQSRNGRGLGLSQRDEALLPERPRQRPFSRLAQQAAALQNLHDARPDRTAARSPAARYARARSHIERGVGSGERETERRRDREMERRREKLFRSLCPSVPPSLCLSVSHSRSERPRANPLLLSRRHQDQTTSGRRDHVSRGGVHGRAL